MACDIHDREGESPSPMELRLGRTFRSWATGRRRDKLLPTRSDFVKPRDPRHHNAGNQTRQRSAASHASAPALSPLGCSLVNCGSATQWPLSGSPKMGGYRSRPAVMEIVGARRERTVSTISMGPIPCR